MSRKDLHHAYLFLSGLKYVTTVQEERLHLVDTTRRNKDEIEDGKKPQLKRESAVSNLPERESTEEAGEDMEEELVPHVVLVLCQHQFPCANSGTTYR